MSMLAWRNLIHDKVRLAVTLTGIMFAVVLIVVEFGLFLGFTTTTSSLIDRVVCCYPAYEPLLTAALDRASHAVGLSYPRDRWYVRAVMALDNRVRRLRGGAFRTFVHAPTGMSALLRAGGFHLVGRRTTLTWSVDVYTRMNAAAHTHEGHGNVPAVSRV
jgi:hypothetical protein